MDRKQLLQLARESCNKGAGDALTPYLLDTLAAMDDDALQKRLLKDLIRAYVVLEKRVDTLLKNTLPAAVAEEIKYEGRFTPRPYLCTILFSDFKGFTALAEKISGTELIEYLSRIFTGFDELILKFDGTKIKTIGDAYMAVFGAPVLMEDHAIKAVFAAMEMMRFLDRFNREGNGPAFSMRIGIHTGPVNAGVVGKERLQFDVFGDSVNIASRFESSGEPGKINVSETTYQATRHAVEFSERGYIQLKNKADMKAFFVEHEQRPTRKQGDFSHDRRDNI